EWPGCERILMHLISTAALTAVCHSLEGLRSKRSLRPESRSRGLFGGPSAAPAEYGAARLRQPWLKQLNDLVRPFRGCRHGCRQTFRSLHVARGHFLPIRIQNLAEGEGFEPPKACTLVVFKTTAIDHSAIPPATINNTAALTPLGDAWGQRSTKAAEARRCRSWR